MDDRRRAGSAWTSLGTVKTQGDGLVAMLCEPKKVTLLTSRRLVEWTGEHERTVPLQWDPSMSLVTSVHPTKEALFVGFNAGEWGGGLRRIDRATGKVVTVERNASGELCGGPLNTSCDPVHAIADEPWKSGCVVAAVGLSHLGLISGGLVEVCGNAIEFLNVKPSKRSRDRWPLHATRQGSRGGDAATCLQEGGRRGGQLRAARRHPRLDVHQPAGLGQRDCSDARPALSPGRAPEDDAALGAA